MPDIDGEISAAAVRAGLRPLGDHRPAASGRWGDRRSCRFPVTKPGLFRLQVELLKTFAEQAVIAIASAETIARWKPARGFAGVAGIPDRDQRRAEGH